MVCFPDHNNVVKAKLKFAEIGELFLQNTFYDQITDQNMLGV